MFRYLPLAFIIALAAFAGHVLASDRMKVKILDCYDGDTCTADREILPGRDRIRIANIDAPEIEGKCLAERQLASLAHAFARMLAKADNQEVWLTEIHEDRYPRRVDAHVTLHNGADMGELLILGGFAQRWDGRRVDWCH